jgi:drug/metabolite transporter (DMT)-like permease
MLVGGWAEWVAEDGDIATQPMHLTARVLLSVLALGVLGTGMAYVWNTAVVAQWGATNASTVTYLTPLIGVALGVVVLNESVSWNQPVGAAVVVLGIVISQNRLLPTMPSRRSRRPTKR